MTTKPVAVYWDSCVYIDYIQREEAHYQELREIMSEARSGRIIFVASTLVIAEVVKLRQSTEPLQQQAELIRDAFENDYIQVVSVTRDIAAEAAQLCRDFSIRPPDAIHLTTALHRQCRCFQTCDAHLLELDGKIGRPPLKIEFPHRLFQAQLLLPDDPEA